MKVIKANLPEGVKKQFAKDRGVKVKLINKKMYEDKKKKEMNKKNADK